MMPDFGGAVIGILSLLVIYFMVTRAEDFSDGNVGADDVD